MLNEFYNVKEVAKMLSVNTETVRRWIRRGELAADDFGGNVGYRITLAQLENFLKNHKKWEYRVEEKDSRNRHKRDLTLEDISEMGFSETLTYLLASNEDAHTKRKKVEIISQKNKLIENRNQIIRTINIGST